MQLVHGNQLQFARSVIQHLWKPPSNSSQCQLAPSQEDVLFTLARLAEASGAPPLAAAVSGSQYPQLVQQSASITERIQQPVV